MAVTTTAQKSSSTTESPLDLLLERTQPQLQKIKKILLDNFTRRFPLIKDVAGHILSSTGKSIRPLLTLTFYDLLKTDNAQTEETALILAASIECIHTATLLHDDVIDESLVRRSQKSAHLIWGNKATILVGDFLFSESFDLMLQSNRLDILKAFSKTSQALIEGEIKQLSYLNSFDLSFDDYLDMIASKTGSLFSSACEIGAMCASTNEDQINKSYLFGLNLGIAFQIVDDLLDYFGDSYITGKINGKDFYEGKVTLPILLAMQKGTPKDQETIRSLMMQPTKELSDFNLLKQILVSLDVEKDGQNIADTFVQKACQNMTFTSCNSLIQSHLIDLSHFLTSRKN